MFSAAITELSRACERLQGAGRNLERRIEEVEWAAGELRRMSGYEDILPATRHLVDDLKEERRKIICMAGTCREIQELYAECERRNLNYKQEV